MKNCSNCRRSRLVIREDFFQGIECSKKPDLLLFNPMNRGRPQAIPKECPGWKRMIIGFKVVHQPKQKRFEE